LHRRALGDDNAGLVTSVWLEFTQTSRSRTAPPAMTSTEHVARALMALVLLLAQQPLQAMNDALLEQIRQASTRHGPQTVRR
jgi:hypothetical protein